MRSVEEKVERAHKTARVFLSMVMASMAIMTSLIVVAGSIVIGVNDTMAAKAVVLGLLMLLLTFIIMGVSSIDDRSREAWLVFASMIASTWLLSYATLAIFIGESIDGGIFLLSTLSGLIVFLATRPLGHLSKQAINEAVKAMEEDES